MNSAPVNPTAKRFEMPGRMIIACWFEGDVQTSPDDIQAITRCLRAADFQLNKHCRAFSERNVKFFVRRTPVS
jgi:hypothetical protein